MCPFSTHFRCSRILVKNSMFFSKMIRNWALCLIKSRNFWLLEVNEGIKGILNLKTDLRNKSFFGISGQFYVRYGVWLFARIFFAANSSVIYRHSLRKKLHEKLPNAKLNIFLWTFVLTLSTHLIASFQIPNSKLVILPGDARIHDIRVELITASNVHCTNYHLKVKFSLSGIYTRLNNHIILNT